MYLLTVSPLVNGIPYEELTYFSKADVAPGDLVEITIRKRICRALVLSVTHAEAEKQSLKNASFVTKKITGRKYSFTNVTGRRGPRRLHAQRWAEIHKNTIVPIQTNNGKLEVFNTPFIVA